MEGPHTAKDMVEKRHMCHGSTGPQYWVLWFLRYLVDLCAQLLDIAQALGVDVLSVLKESRTMEEAERGLSSSGIKR